MKFRVELDIPTHVPPPAVFVFATVYFDDGVNPERAVPGTLNMHEDVARAFAERVNGEPWQQREWDDEDDEDPRANRGDSEEEIRFAMQQERWAREACAADEAV